LTTRFLMQNISNGNVHGTPHKNKFKFRRFSEPFEELQTKQTVGKKKKLSPAAAKIKTAKKTEF